jgi:hypothetical protein
LCFASSSSSVPTHVMMLTRIRIPCCWVVLDDDSYSMLRKKRGRKRNWRIKDRRTKSSVNSARMHPYYSDESSWKSLLLNLDLSYLTMYRINMRKKMKFNVSQITIIKQACIKQNDDDDGDGEWTTYTHLRRLDLLKISQPITDQFLTIHIIHTNSMILDLILALCINLT